MFTSKIESGVVKPESDLNCKIFVIDICLRDYSGKGLEDWVPVRNKKPAIWKLTRPITLIFDCTSQSVAELAGVQSI